MTVNEELKKLGVAVTQPETQSESILSVLQQLGYRFRLNMADMSIEVNGGPISDIAAAEIRMVMRDRGVKNMAAVEDAYMVEARRNSYHPIKDYLNALTWDGNDHISALAAKLQSENEPVRYRDGTTLPLHAVYLYRWLLGAVAKVLDGEQNPMLVWDGPQGLGKSLLARWLCPVAGAFIEGPINVQDKDSDVRLMSKFIWEVSELDATTRRADVSALKSFITKGHVVVRKAYGRHDVNGAAICSFIGTVNNSTGFLADATGSRRFYICKLTAIDWSYRKLDVDQVWAQAVALYLGGEKPNLTPEESAVQQSVNDQYQVETPLEDWIEEHFTITHRADDTLSIAEIIKHLDMKGIKLSGSERAQAMEIALVLTRKKLIKRHTKTGKVWQGIVLNHSG